MSPSRLVCPLIAALLACACSKKSDAWAALDASVAKVPPSFGSMPRAGDQSYPDAWKTFCDAEQQLGDLEAIPKPQRAQLLANWMHEHVRNQDFVFFMAEMQGTKPLERRLRYQEQLAAAGIAKCALGEKFFPAPASP